MAGDIFGYTSVQAISAQSDGVSRSPTHTFESERSLGWYRSAASTMAASYGTVDLSATIVTMGATSNRTSTFSGSITVAASGYTGTPLMAFSAVSCAMPAQVVQGSASTFTILVWPAARANDFIGVTVGTGVGISSLSSGLVFHSHCTVAGQVEIRISNVSTLVQNQSAQSLFLYRLSAF